MVYKVKYTVEPGEFEVSKPEPNTGYSARGVVIISLGIATNTIMGFAEGRALSKRDIAEAIRTLEHYRDNYAVEVH